MRSKYHEEYYKKNREEILRQQAEYKAKNTEKLKKCDKKYKQKHRVEIKKQKAEWYKKNIDSIRLHNHKNKVKRLLWNSEWIKRHPEVAARRRTRKSNAGGSFTAEEWNTLCSLYKYRCLCCHRKKKLTADHVIPVSKGGSSNIENIQPLCKSCNSKKNTKVIDYRTINLKETVPNQSEEN